MNPGNTEERGREALRFGAAGRQKDTERRTDPERGKIAERGTHRESRADQWETEMGGVHRGRMPHHREGIERHIQHSLCE